jgi:hypothetical protein
MGVPKVPPNHWAHRRMAFYGAETSLCDRHGGTHFYGCFIFKKA